MAYFSVNCGYDPVYFELCLSGILESKVSCVLLSAQPLGYLHSPRMRMVFEAFAVHRSDFYLFLVRKPIAHRLLFSGISSVFLCTIQVDSKTIGVIGTNFYDVLQETTDLLDFSIPTLMSSFMRLLHGGADLNGNVIKPCDAVVVMGSLICRGLPIGEEFVWPSLTYSGFPGKSLCLTHVQTLACIYQPFFYEWREECVYLDANKIGPNAVGAALDNILKLGRETFFRGAFAEFDVNESNNKPIADGTVFESLCDVYKSSSYTHWRDQGISISRPDWRCAKAADFIFSSTWVQVFTPEPVNVYSDRCIHYVVGPRDSESVLRAPSAPGFISETYERSIYKPIKICRVPLNTSLSVDVILHEEDFAAQVSAFAKLFSSPDVKTRPEKFVLYKLRLTENLVHIGHFCQIKITPSLAEPSYCVFGLTHSLEHGLI